MAFGLVDSTYIDWPSNVSDSYLRGLTTRSGLRFTDLAGAIDRRLGSVNGGVDPLVAALLAPPTDSAYAWGNTSGVMRVERKAEYTLTRPQLVERTAHMLAMGAVEITLGFTEDGLNRMSLDAFNANVQAMGDALERSTTARSLGRLFAPDEVPIEENVASTSPGFAGSGSGGNVFVGQYTDGTALPGGYTHYYRDTAANRAVVTKAARDRLLRWHAGPFDLVGSSAFVSALSALPDFIPTGSALVRPAQGTAEALLDPTQYVGVYNNNLRVWQPRNEWTSDHAAIFKSYGAFSTMNPLVWRYDPLYGRDAYVRSRELYPLALAAGIWHWEPNVNNRVGAALIEVDAAGDYSAPSIVW